MDKTALCGAKHKKKGKKMYKKADLERFQLEGFMTRLAEHMGLEKEAAKKKKKKKMPCPGSKIRSKGKGRGMGVGKGKGPVGRMKYAEEMEKEAGKGTRALGLAALGILGGGAVAAGAQPEAAMDLAKRVGEKVTGSGALKMQMESHRRGLAESRMQADYAARQSASALSKLKSTSAKEIGGLKSLIGKQGKKLTEREALIEMLKSPEGVSKTHAQAIVDAGHKRFKETEAAIMATAGKPRKIKFENGLQVGSLRHRLRLKAGGQKLPTTLEEAFGKK